MLKHYLKTAARSLLRKKMYTFINVFSLSIGLALCLAILGHMSYEMSFEDFHVNRDRIYRVECDYKQGDEQFSSAGVMAPLGKLMAQEIPEVDNVAVFRVGQITSVRVGEERTRIIDEYSSAGYAHHNKLVFADADYFEVFTFPAYNADLSSALTEPYSLLISQDAAQEYFPNRNPIGEAIMLNDRLECRVTGILKNIPQNTQLYTDFIISYGTLEREGGDVTSWEEFNGDYAYLTLQPGADPSTVAAKIPSVVGSHLSTDTGVEFGFRLKPLKEIFFDTYFSGNRGELNPGGEWSVIIAFGLVAFFILFQAIANFVNLSTARSADRVKEVGVRKVLGAVRSHLIRQFLGESVVIAVASMVLGIVTYELFKIYIQDSLPREAMVDVYRDPMMFLYILGLVLVVGVLGGYYPALYLSRFQPIAVLQRKGAGKSSRSLLRKGLVVFQFAVAAVFIFCTTVIVRQTRHITSMDLGFDTENILVVGFDGEAAADSCRIFKNDLINSGRVRAASMVSSPPGESSYRYAGLFKTEERLDEEMMVMNLFDTDYDFLPMFGLEVVQGRAFSPDVATDAANGILITESAAKEMKRDNPVGTKLYGSGDRFYEIIGVVKDFHGAALRFGYRSSLVLRINPEKYRHLCIKLPAHDPKGSVAAVKDTWDRTFPGAPLEYDFLTSMIDANYDEERSQSQMFGLLAVFTIAIGCLGIFGLVSYTAEQRTKEIGIRKVLGASVRNIVTMLSKEFVLLVLIGNAIAFPVGYLMMDDFLSYQPFRVGMGPGTYAFVAAIGLFFALATASFKSVKAGMANPVDSMRDE